MMNAVRTRITDVSNAFQQSPSEGDTTQLTQVTVPLDQASAAFATPDHNGRLPIVVIPSQPSRIHGPVLSAAVLVAVTGVIFWWIFNNQTVGWICFLLAAVLTAVAVYRSFYVVIPEGISALLVQGGQNRGMIGSGAHVLKPIVAVSHLVTRREIPYDAPLIEAPTKDNVRAAIDVLVTFVISDPAKFVYTISADDFDHVFQAACQDAVRRLVRTITWDQIGSVAASDLGPLEAALTEDVSRYGVTVTDVIVTYAAPPLSFIESEESRQLATLQRAEQAERQLLAERRQNDDAALEKMKLAAHAIREREAQEMAAETRRRIAEIDAETDALRLAKREDAIRRNPMAAQYELQQAQLAVARSLAGNTRAVVQMGGSDEISRAMLIRELAPLSVVTENGGSPGDAAAETAPPTP